MVGYLASRRTSSTRSAGPSPPKTSARRNPLGGPQTQFQPRQQHRARLRLRLLPDRPRKVRLSAGRGAPDSRRGASALRRHPRQAELTQEGDLIVTFDSGLSPTTLPRQGPVPVAVRVAGDSKAPPATAPSCPSCARSRSRSTVRDASTTAVCRPAGSRRSNPPAKTRREGFAGGRSSGRATSRCRSTPRPRPSRSGPNCSPSTAPKERPQADLGPGLRKRPSWGLRPHLPPKQHGVSSAR